MYLMLKLCELYLNLKIQIHASIVEATRHTGRGSLAHLATAEMNSGLSLSLSLPPRPLTLSTFAVLNVYLQVHIWLQNFINLSA